MSLLVIANENYIARLCEETALKLGGEDVTPSNHPDIWHSSSPVMMPSGVGVRVYKLRGSDTVVFCSEGTQMDFDPLRQFRLDRQIFKS